MLKPILIAAVVSLGGFTSAFAQECIHGPIETAADRTRREQAVQFARRLNVEQQLTFPGQSPRYRALDELRTLPPVPAGFQLQFHTDGRSYSLSLKDRRDPCRFAVFSDQGGDIYATTPEPARATVIPAETR